MIDGAINLLAIIRHELTLFAAAGLAIGGIVDLVIDLVFLFRRGWRRIAVYSRHPRMSMAARAAQLQQELKALETVIADKEAQAAQTQLQALQPEMIGEVEAVIAQVEVPNQELLRSLADQLRDRMKKGVVLLASVQEDKVSLVAMATKEAVAAKAHAGNLVKEVAKIVGGGGGGRPDMAQAGGKDPAKLAEALLKAKETLRQQLGL